MYDPVNNWMKVDVARSSLASETMGRFLGFGVFFGEGWLWDRPMSLKKAQQYWAAEKKELDDWVATLPETVYE
jgi:hypothetical protein